MSVARHWTEDDADGVCVELTPKEIQTLTAAMAGNFPESLSEYRWGVLKKLARASHGKRDVAAVKQRKGA